MLTQTILGWMADVGILWLGSELCELYGML